MSSSGRGAHRNHRIHAWPSIYREELIHSITFIRLLLLIGLHFLQLRLNLIKNATFMSRNLFFIFSVWRYFHFFSRGWLVKVRKSFFISLLRWDSLTSDSYCGVVMVAYCPPQHCKLSKGEPRQTNIPHNSDKILQLSGSSLRGTDEYLQSSDCSFCCTMLHMHASLCRFLVF